MQELIKSFTNTLENYSIELLQISNGSAAIKKYENKWSQKEILGHLIDSANVNYNRFIRAMNSDNLIFDTYPQDEWVNLQQYNTRDWIELINLWKLLNLHIVELWGQIPTIILDRRTGKHNLDKICWKEVPKNEETSLSYLIKDYIGHLEHHLKQIFNF